MQIEYDKGCRLYALLVWMVAVEPTYENKGAAAEFIAASLKALSHTNSM